MLWLYGEFAAVRVILQSWRARAVDADFLEDFEERHPMPPASAVCGWLGSGIGRLPYPVGRPGRDRPEPRPAGDPGEVERARALWDGLHAATAVMGQAEKEIMSLGPLGVLRHALAVPGAERPAAHLIAARSVMGDLRFADAVDLIGADFSGIYFPLLVDLAVTDAFAAPRVRHALRRAATAAGRPDLARQAADAELSAYGTHGGSDDNCWLIGIRE